jgi:dCTP deaminase
MAFWSTQRVRAEQKRLGNLIQPYDSDSVKQGAYELTLSREVLTSPPAEGPRLDGTGKALEIRPGDFALLYTNETVTIPANVIGFISIKAGLKLDGLVNISGFHVDPGFSTRLKFSVHNAGPLPIYLNYDEPAFLIWFSDLDAHTVDPYGKSHQHYKQSGITPGDRQRMSLKSYSPAALNARLEHLERKFRYLIAIGLIVVTGILVPLVKSWIESQLGHGASKAETPSPTPSVTPNPYALTLPSTPPAVTTSPLPTTTSAPTVISTPAATPKLHLE